MTCHGPAGRRYAAPTPSHRRRLPRQNVSPAHVYHVYRFDPPVSSISILQRFLLFGQPAIAALFSFVYHIGLGQPGLLRGTLLGTVLFYTSTGYCYWKVGAPLSSCLSGGLSPW